jgi:hypothetical protein
MPSLYGSAAVYLYIQVVSGIYTIICIFAVDGCHEAVTEKLESMDERWLACITHPSTSGIGKGRPRKNTSDPTFTGLRDQASASSPAILVALASV